VNPDRTGPDLQTCAICNQSGYAPELVPYLKVEGKGHIWAHPMCKWATMEAKRAKDGIPERHEHGDGI